MALVIQILLLAIGLALVIKGADFLVEGASAIARKYRVSEFVIGLTIVGFGTSCPELVVSATGALQGSSDIASGNVIGSNTFNVLFILGITALIYPVSIDAKNRHFDLPVLIGITLLFVGLGMCDTLFGFGPENVISRIDALIMLSLFGGYIYMCFKKGSKENETLPAEGNGMQAVAEGNGESAVGTAAAIEKKPMKMWIAILLCASGLAGLIFGGKLFVNAATEIARMASLSEKFIAITILAAGTSLPELVTCIVAAYKGKIQLALGNVMGSNIFNILLILGISALIHPVSMANINYVDIAVVVGSTLLIALSCFTQRDNKVSRWDGLMMVACGLAYIIYLISDLS